MGYLSKIGVENFKIFKDYHEIKISDLTVITGKNNCGKSSIHKLLYLISQNITYTNKPFIESLKAVSYTI